MGFHRLLHRQKVEKVGGVQIGVGLGRANAMERQLLPRIAGRLLRRLHHHRRRLWLPLHAMEL